MRSPSSTPLTPTRRRCSHIPFLVQRLKPAAKNNNNKLIYKAPSTGALLTMKSDDYGACLE